MKLVRLTSGEEIIGKVEDLSNVIKISDAFKVKMDRITWFELYTAALGREVA